MEGSNHVSDASAPLRVQKSSRLRVGTEITTLSPLTSPISKPVSPLGDESVLGYPSDVKPKYHGAKEIVSVVQTIEALNISCCVVGEAALIYYGAKRMIFDWLICVPTENLEQVQGVLQAQPERFEVFRPSALSIVGSLNVKFPRFKLVGQATFFILLSAQACHLNPTPHSVEYDRWIHIPYPRLAVYAQSLLDTWNTTDLEDLIDGMNLDVPWGDSNLRLGGHVDQAWACWRESILADRELEEDEKPKWSDAKRGIWEKAASNDAKLKRQGWKARPNQLTRFWMAGQEDPRLKVKDYS